MAITPSDITEARPFFLAGQPDPRVSGLDAGFGAIYAMTDPAKAASVLQKISSVGADPLQWLLIAGGAASPGLPPPFGRYVDANIGDDVTGTGGIAAPFKTITKAISTCPNNTQGYVIFINAGNYPENVVLQSNISLIGLSVPQITSLGGIVSLTAGAGDNVIIQVRNLAIQNPVVLDLALAGGGNLSFANGLYSLNRIDPAGAPFISIGQCGINNSSIAGGICIIDQGIIFGTFTGLSGSLLTCINGIMVGGSFDLQGTAQLKTLSCEQIFPTNFVNGVAVGPDTPIWRTDASSNFASTGALQKTVFGSPVKAFEIYADSSLGSDALGDGSFDRPFQTIAKALTLAVNPASQYAIMLVAGEYTEAPIVWKSNTHLIGRTGVVARVNAPVSYTAGPGDNPFLNFKNVAFTSGPFTIDGTLAVGGNLNFEDANVTIARADSNAALPIVMNNTILAGNNLPGNTVLRDCILVSNLDVPVGSSLTLMSCIIIGTVITLNGNASLKTVGCASLFGGGAYVNGVIVGPDTPTWATDFASYPASPRFTGDVAVSVYGAVVKAFDFYVDNLNGSDVFGNGTYELPFKTIPRAALLCADPATSYVIHLLSQNYNDVDFVLLNHISLVGESRSSTVIQNACTYNATPAIDSNFELRNIKFAQAVHLQLAGTTQGTVKINSCYLEGLKEGDASIDVRVTNCEFQDCGFIAKKAFFVGCSFNGTVNIDAGNIYSLSACTIKSPAAFTVSDDAVIRTVACEADPNFLTGVPAGSTPEWFTDKSTDVTFLGALTKIVY